MRVLITGVTGLIGSHLAPRLKQEGHEVYGVSTGTTVLNRSLIERSCTFTELDLTNSKETVAYIETLQPDLIYHLAANAAESRGQFSPMDMTERNMKMTMNVVVGAVRGYTKRIVFTSSIAVYGTILAPFRETDDPKPQDIYGINKLAIEKALKVLSSVHGFEYVIVRPHNVYGTQQCMTDPYRNVVALFMSKLLRGEPYAIYGDGSMTRCFSYVEDVVDVLIKVAWEKVHGCIFNVGSSTPTSIKQLSDLIQQVSSRHVPPLLLPDRPQEVHSAASDHTLQNALFGYTDTPLEEGLRRVWAWVNQVGNQEYAFSDAEIESTKIPANWQKAAL